jgi:hypothetical protein
MALSAAVGTWAGLQLPAAFQLPVPPIQTRSAAFAPIVKSMAMLTRAGQVSKVCATG